MKSLELKYVFISKNCNSRKENSIRGEENVILFKKRICILLLLVSEEKELCI
jgi:hypothetical protein